MAALRHWDAPLVAVELCHRLFERVLGSFHSLGCFSVHFAYNERVFSVLSLESHGVQEESLLVSQLLNDWGLLESGEHFTLDLLLLI